MRMKSWFHGCPALAVCALAAVALCAAQMQPTNKPTARVTTRKTTVPAKKKPVLLFPVIYQEPYQGLGKKLGGHIQSFFGSSPSGDKAVKQAHSGVSWATVEPRLTSIPSYMPNDLREFVCNTFLDLASNDSLVIPSVMYMTHLAYTQTASAARWYMLKTLADIVVPPTFLWLSDNIDMGDCSVTLLESRFLSLSPSLRDEARAITDLLLKYNWHTFSIVATDTFGKTQFINAIHEIQQSSEENQLTLCDILHLPAGLDNATAASYLMDLTKSDTRIYVLHATLIEASAIMQAAAALKLTGDEHLWIANHAVMEFGSKAGIFSQAKLPQGMLGITFEQSGENTLREVSRNAVLLWINASTSFLYNAINSGAFTLEMLQNSTASAIRRACSNNSHDEPENNENTRNSALYDFSLRLAEFYRNEINTSSVRERLVNFTVYNYQTAVGWRAIGNWFPDKGIQISDIAWPGQSINPPTGKPKKYRLRVLTLREDPFVIYSQMVGGKCERSSRPCKTNSPNGTVMQCCSGFCIDLLIRLGGDLRFDFDLEEVADGKWGGLDKATGEWNGLVRALIDNKADAVMTSLKITPDRSSVVEFSVPYLETGIRIIVTMSSGKISATAFLEPYDAVAWCLILIVSVHISAALIFTFENIINYYGKGKRHVSCDKDNSGPKEEGYSLCRVTWLIWSLLFGASCRSDNPHGLSSRVLTYVYALFSLVFLASYTANLAAFMITKDTWHDISGIRDPALMHLRFGTIPSGATEETIRKNFPSMYRHMAPHGRDNVDDGIEAVKNDSLDAFAYDARVLEYKAVNDPRCRLQTVGKMYAMTGYGVAFAKNSHWRAKFSERILEYQDDGSLERMEKIWMTGACSQKDAGDSSNVLHIKNFASAFILVGAATGISLILLCFEHVYFRFLRPFVKKFNSYDCCFLLSEAMSKSLQDDVMERPSRQNSVLTSASESSKGAGARSEELARLHSELQASKVEAARLKSLLRDNGIEYSAQLLDDASSVSDKAQAQLAPTEAPESAIIAYPSENFSRYSTVTSGKKCVLSEAQCTCRPAYEEADKLISSLPEYGSGYVKLPTTTNAITSNTNGNGQVQPVEFPLELYDNRPDWPTGTGSSFNGKSLMSDPRNLNLNLYGTEPTLSANSLYSLSNNANTDSLAWTAAKNNPATATATGTGTGTGTRTGATPSDAFAWTLRNEEGDARDRRIREEIEKSSSC